MSEIQITWPRSLDEHGNMQYPIRPSKPFAAAVSASSSVVRVDAVCRNMSTGEAKDGRMISLTRRYAAVHSTFPNQWIIFFDRREADTYELQVTPYSLDGQLETVTRQFKIAIREFIDIDSHYDYENISDQKNDFLAYGEINAFQLGVAKMTPNGSGDPVYPTSTYSDSMVLQFWCAQFPALAGGTTYTLVAEDSVQSSLDSVTGLQVN